MATKISQGESKRKRKLKNKLRMHAPYSIRYPVKRLDPISVGK